MWNNTSASQSVTFQDCQRKWFFGSILKPFPKVTTESQQRGSDIHAEAEHYLHTGNLRDSDYQGLNYRRYAEALVPFMPPARHPELIIEHGFLMPTLEGLPPWKGFIDHGISAADETITFGDVTLFPGQVYLGDIKSLSDFRYARTPEELKQSTQMISYARWAYTIGHTGDIDVGHLYIKTQKKQVPKSPKTLHRVVTLDEAEVMDCWGQELEVVKEMKALSVVTDPQDVPPTGAPNVCKKYGGCEFRALCGQVETRTSNSKQQQQRGNITMGFLNKVKENAKTKTSNGTNGEHVETNEAPKVATKKKGGFLGKAKAKAGKAPEDGQVLPDDAPSRETEVKADETETEEKKTSRGRPKGSTNSKKKFVLYVNCAPIKGQKVTLFEEFITPIIDKLNAEAQETGLAHFRQADFSTEKIAYAEAIKANLDELPPRMLVRTDGMNAREALEVLRPHATEIVEGLR